MTCITDLYSQQDFNIWQNNKTMAAKYVTASSNPTITSDTIRKWRSKFSNVDNIFWMGKPAAMKLLEQYTGLPMVDATVLKDKAVHQLSTKQNKEKGHDSELEKQLERFSTLVGSAQENLTDKGYTLVHCQAGINRSSAVAVGVLISAAHKSCQEAWRMVREQQPKADTQEAFTEITETFENWCRNGKPDTFSKYYEDQQPPN